MNLTVSPRTFDMKDLMKVLFDYEGLHTFTLAVTDEANRRSTFELKVRVRQVRAEPIPASFGAATTSRRNTR